MRPLVISWCAVVCAAGLLGCGARQPKPGTVQDEAMRAGVTPEQLVRSGPAADYFHDMDDNVVNGAPRRELTPAEVAGRAMWLLWTGGNDRLWDRLTVDSFGTFDLLKTISSHPGMCVRTSQPLPVPGTRQRAVLRRTGGPRPRSLGVVDRPPRSSLPARSVCRRGPLPGRAHRRTRPDDARGLVLRRADRCRRTPAVPEPRVRRESQTALERRSLLHRPELLQRSQAGSPLSCRDVVRVLSRGPEPHQASRGSRTPEVGEPQLERRRAVLLVGSHLPLAGGCGRVEPFLPDAARLAARHARHLARVHRQHRQSAHDERDLRALRPHGAGEEVGQGDAVGR